MHRLKSEVLDDLAHAVVEMEENKAVELAREAMECGIDPYAAMDGLSKGMEMVVKKYESGEYFIPELIVCSDTLYAGLKILKPHLGSRSAKSLGRAVIGVVEGDIHDIGKNLVKLMLEFSGLEIYDLGRDVPLRTFLEESGKVGAHLICMSTLMTTSMSGMEEVIAMLGAEGVRERYKVMIGGGPISQKYADRIGAEGYAPNAAAAVKKAKELLVVRNTRRYEIAY
jgi:corrinoid protein of di/trimethylamine methyltransferase